MRAHRRSFLATGIALPADVDRDPERCASRAVTCPVQAKIVQGGEREDSDDPRIVALMRKANYHGCLTLDYESAEEPLTANPKHVEAIQKATG